MNSRRLMWFLPYTLICATAMAAQDEAYPPLREYLMARDSELALVQSAAPPRITEHATLHVLTASGYEVARAGENGFVCLVLRGWSAPTYTPDQFRKFVYDARIRAPICFDSASTRTVLPYYLLRSRLGMAGRSPRQIADSVQAAYATAGLPQRGSVSFAYMWSADQFLGQGIGHWHPHMMVFAPYYQNAMLGAHPFGGPFPQVSDDAGTPFAVVVIPVAHELAIHASGGQR